MKLFILLSLVFILFNCSPEFKSKLNNNLPDTNIDSSLFVIISYDSIYSNAKEKFNSINLNIPELQKLDSILTSAINTHNSQLDSNLHEDYYIILEEYKRQYVPMINQESEKIVWVNCFCDDFNNENKFKILQIEDGGKCYFNLKINLSTNEWFNLMINGNA